MRVKFEIPAAELYKMLSDVELLEEWDLNFTKYQVLQKNEGTIDKIYFVMKAPPLTARDREFV